MASTGWMIVVLQLLWQIDIPLLIPAFLLFDLFLYLILSWIFTEEWIGFLSLIPSKNWFSNKKSMDCESLLRRMYGSYAKTCHVPRQSLLTCQLWSNTNSILPSSFIFMNVMKLEMKAVWKSINPSLQSWWWKSFGNCWKCVVFIFFHQIVLWMG